MVPAAPVGLVVPVPLALLPVVPVPVVAAPVVPVPVPMVPVDGDEVVVPAAPPTAAGVSFPLQAESTTTTIIIPQNREVRRIWHPSVVGCRTSARGHRDPRAPAFAAELVQRGQHGTAIYVRQHDDQISRPGPFERG